MDITRQMEARNYNLPDELVKRDPREPFPEQDYLDECDTCVGTPHSHVCRGHDCHQAITATACEMYGGLCRECFHKGER